MFYPTPKFLGDKPRLRPSNEKDRLRQYYVLYTAMFAFMCFIVFCWYFLSGRTFIWEVDGWRQHYKALVYYAKYLRSIIRELLYNYRFVIPEWDFVFGEGNDIFQTLHYYVIGDPFAVFSFLVPIRFLWIYYDFMILFRLYLSGIAFSCLCFYTKKNIGRYAVMAGALSYIFCYWAILNANGHPCFLNPMLYFPLIILGVEKILRKEKSYLLTVSVFLAAISNFYFFYNIVLMTVAYVTVRLITKYKSSFKSMLNAFLRIAGGSILGTAMGGVVLLPVIVAFLNDTRMDSEATLYLMYRLSYYGKLLGAFFTGYGDHLMCMGYAAPVILAIFLLFMRKGQYRLLKVCFLLCLIIIFVPALGQFLNGMSYRSNKWCWAFALLCTYIFVVMWPELMSLKSKEAFKLALFLGILLFLVICFEGVLMPNYPRTFAAVVCIGIAFIFLLVIFPFRLKSLQQEVMWKQWKQATALALVIIAIGLVSAVLNAPIANNYAQDGMYAEDVAEQLMRTEVNAVQEAAASDDAAGFYRYSGRNLTDNAGMLYNLSNTNYYWSISNPAVSLFRSTMELCNTVVFYYEGYDDRTALITLSSVKYFVVHDDDNEPIPYGFTYVENAATSNYKVYRNENALPVSYVYDTIISEERWNDLSSVEKQEVMLQSVLLTGYDGETQDGVIDSSSQSLDYFIDCNDPAGITLEDHRFVVKSANSSVTISFEGLVDSETYFSINGLDFDGTSYVADLELRCSSGASRTLACPTEDYRYYNYRHDYTVNLGYAEDAVTSITITFSEIGVYSFDSIEVICQPMDNYAKHVASLKKTGLENVYIGTDIIRGNISLDKPQVLCFSVPYSVGWMAYVDGEEATLYQANIKNMALVLDAGDHDVKLEYHTPYLRMGAGLSAVGFIVFSVLLLLNGYKKRRAMPKCLRISKKQVDRKRKK